MLKRGPRVTWDDVALDPAVRAALEENTFGILRRRKLFQVNGIPQKRGVLLYGPPGTGKTMIGKALADSHAGTFLWATAADVKSSEAVRTIFGLARKLRPTIVFLEDLDMFASERGGCTDVTLGELLTQMDGLESNDGVIVVATTNDLAAIEPALAERPSRFDVVLEVGLPAHAARRRILAQNCANRTRLATCSTWPPRRPRDARVLRCEKLLFWPCSVRFCEDRWMRTGCRRSSGRTCRRRPPRSREPANERQSGFARLRGDDRVGRRSALPGSPDLEGGRPRTYNDAVSKPNVLPAECSPCRRLFAVSSWGVRWGAERL